MLGKFDNTLFENKKYYIINFIIYRLLLDISYIFAVHVIYEYSGFVLEFNIGKYFLSILTLILFSYVYKDVFSQHIASSHIIILLTYVYFVPMSSLYGLHGLSNSFYLFIICYWGILLFAQLRIPILVFQKVQLKYSAMIYTILIFLAFILVIYVSYKFTGFRFTLNFLENTYEIRAEAADYQMSRLISYALSNLGIILPIMLLYTLYIKKYLLSLVIIVISILNYSIAMHKTQLFTLVIAVFCFCFYKKIYMYISAIILSSLVGVSILVFYLLDNIYPISLFVRRVMYVPTLISYQYFEFFNINNLSIFQDSLLNKVGFEKEYVVSISNVLAQFISNRAYSANNGLIGDAYANLGMLGIFIMPVILVITLRLLDAVSFHIDSRILITICVYFTMAFTNSSWSTILLTHGFIITCVALYFFPSTQEEGTQYQNAHYVTIGGAIKVILSNKKVVIRNMVCFMLIGGLIGCFYVQFIEKPLDIQIDSVSYLEKDVSTNYVELNPATISYQSSVYAKLNELDELIVLFTELDLSKLYSKEINFQLNKLNQLKLSYNAVFQRVIFSDSGNYQYRYAKMYFKNILSDQFDESLLEIYQIEVNKIIDECNLLMISLSNQYKINFLHINWQGSVSLIEITDEYRMNYQLDVKHILLNPDWYSGNKIGDINRVNADLTFQHRIQSTTASSKRSAYFTHKEPNSLENILAFILILTLFGVVMNIYYLLVKKVELDKGIDTLSR